MAPPLFFNHLNQYQKMMKKFLNKPATRLPALLCSVLAFNACKAAYASDAGASDLPDIRVSAQAASGAVSGQVAGASKTNANILETPLAISVVTQEEIRARAASSSAQALEYVSSVVAGQGEGRRDEFYIRGFYSVRDILLDGVRDDNLYQRDLATTERLEVIKGPAAALYGRGSAGGLINRVTKKPQAQQDTELSVMLGSQRQRRVSIDAGGALADDFNARLIAVYDAGASYRDVVEHQRYLLAPSLALRVSSATSLLLQAELQREDRTPDRGIPALNGRPLGVPAATFYGEKFDYTNTASEIAKAHFTHRFHDRLALFNTLQYSHTDLDGVNTRNRRVNANNTLARQITYFPQTQNNFSNQTELRYTTHNHLLLLGLELGQQKRAVRVRQTGTAFPVDLYAPQQILRAPDLQSLPAAIDSRFRAETLGVYLQDQISLAAQWDLLLGARFDQFNQHQTNRLKNNLISARDDHLFSPRLGLVYQATPQQSLYLNLSRSHQPAGGDLLYTGSTALNQVNPLQTDLQEIGYKRDWLDRRWYTSAALFRVLQRNQLTADPSDLTGLRQLQIGKQRNQGLELEAHGALWQGSHLSASYTYNDARIAASHEVKVGNRAEMSPAHNASLWLSQALGGNFHLGAGLLMRSEQFALSDNAVRLPGYARIDMVLGYQQKRYDLKLKLNNIGNISYAESANNNVQVQPGAPFNVSVVLHSRF